MAFYLVTGGCGFIGSHLADGLVADGHRVRILDDLSTGKRNNAPGAAEIVIGDVADAAVARAAINGVDGCFHLAAVASVARANEAWAGTHRVNLTGAINIFDAARTARSGGPVPVVYVSSAAVYGDNDAVPLAEDAATQPLTAYGADKLGCELHARVAHAVHGVPVMGFRFFNIYGPRQDPSSPYSGVISIFIERIGAGDAIDIHGDGEQVRDFVYVRDAVRFLRRGMERRKGEPRVYNVCTGAPISINALAALLCKVAGRTVEIRHVDARPGDIRISIGDGSRAGAELDIRPETAIEAGLADTVQSLIG
ncbi:MAG: NAD-dependent epimerase/dehydratase family protein [Alphaproteobacteria bacterium]